MHLRMQKVHRRKNEQIVKDYVCNHDCGKAYGSYAALYTHIKNKHPNTGTFSEIKSMMAKPKATGKKGRPLKKEKEEPVNNEAPQEYECKICQEEDCGCDEEMGNEEIERSINIMQDSKFVDFINCVGAMSSAQAFSWVRNTEDDYSYLTSEDVHKMFTSFLKDYQLNKTVKVSDLWMQFLSFSSRYWEKRHIVQLYNTIFVINSYESIEDIRIFLNSHIQFQNMRKCAELKVKQFNQLIEILKGQ